MVVITQGSQQTVVVLDGQVHTFQPIKCNSTEIVDTNGAGDSFVGGFLSQFAFGASIEQSVAAGHYCAWECIRRSGATYPATPSFHFNK
jgi:adenosine kinase